MTSKTPSGKGADMTGRDGSEDGEDDYMSMTFAEPDKPNESSLQRTQRLKRESQARGFTKSKAQLAEEEAEARKKALSRSLLDDPRAKQSKGLAMMAKMGFTGGGLGKKTDQGASSGRTEPIMVSVKEDRGGIGLDSENKRRLQEEEAQREAKAVKVEPMDPEQYRERAGRERDEARREKQFHAAQRLIERLDEDEVPGTPARPQPIPRDASSRPLKAIPLVYRGLVRFREEQQHDQLRRRELEQSISRYPRYDDPEADEDDKMALGQQEMKPLAAADDLHEEDEELEKFNALDAGERLRRAVDYLRQNHHYCFWCKMAYPNAQLEGCPGLTEDDHE
ncbi:hypothetical protein CDD83_9822 [Cordyceps sp. RAO-2017]|nr:hypothetical protein CDD83_9822 [Cordyceps sp. RAO-2017]